MFLFIVTHFYETCIIDKLFNIEPEVFNSSGSQRIATFLYTLLPNRWCHCEVGESGIDFS